MHKRNPQLSKLIPRFDSHRCQAAVPPTPTFRWSGLPWSDRDVTAGRSAEGRSLHSLSAVPAHASMRAEPALPPPRGCRTANLLAPRAEGECSTRLPTLRKPRRAGSPSRAARKLQATTPSGSLKRAAILPRVWRKLAVRAHMPHVRRSSCHDVWIDLEQALACIPAILMSTPVTGADTSPIHAVAGKEQE